MNGIHPGPRQRLQPGGKIILVMTRWSTRDLTGALVASQKEAKTDKWHVVEFPAIMDHESEDLNLSGLSIGRWMS